MNIQSIQNSTSQIVDYTDKNDALINVLIGYCEGILENPNSGNMFDILVVLEQLKNQIVLSRHELDSIINALD